MRAPYVVVRVTVPSGAILWRVISPQGQRVQDFAERRQADAYAVARNERPTETPHAAA